MFKQKLWTVVTDKDACVQKITNPRSSSVPDIYCLAKLNTPTTIDYSCCRGYYSIY